MVHPPSSTDLMRALVSSYTCSWVLSGPNTLSNLYCLRSRLRGLEMATCTATIWTTAQSGQLWISGGLVPHDIQLLGLAACAGTGQDCPHLVVHYVRCSLQVLTTASGTVKEHMSQPEGRVNGKSQSRLLSLCTRPDSDESIRTPWSLLPSRHAHQQQHTLPRPVPCHLAKAAGLSWPQLKCPRERLGAAIHMITRCDAHATGCHGLSSSSRLQSAATFHDACLQSSTAGTSLCMAAQWIRLTLHYTPGCMQPQRELALQPEA